MKWLLSREGREQLQTLAHVHALLAFDFDGTLAPIVSDRDGAAMRAETAGLLARLGRLYPCAVISGRSRADVAARLGAASVRYVVGNHGAEPASGEARFAREVSQAKEALSARFASLPGVEIEDKGGSLAVHYRASPSPDTARDEIVRLASLLPSARLVPGKFVVNVVPQHAPHKGDALWSLCQQERSEAALYIGDDDTDEDVFSFPRRGRWLTVRVGTGESAAAFFLRDQGEIDDLLRALVALREAPTRRP
jgi:trehalose 6-phosphate phosphatase